MTERSVEQLDELAKKAAYQVKLAFDLFKEESPSIQQQAHQLIMQRVQRMSQGERVSIDGDLTRVVPEPAPSAPATVNTPEPAGETNCASTTLPTTPDDATP